MTTSTIFISIASYCDPLLMATIYTAARTARHPERLHFGVVDQSPAELPRLELAPGSPIKLSYLRIDPIDARGPCWARHLAMTLYRDEDWFFQIDSHMSFDPGWDEILIDWAGKLGTDRLVISSYPDPFKIVNNVAVHHPEKNHVLAHAVKPDATWDGLVLPFQSMRVHVDRPIVGFHVGAGCLFAPGRIVSELPYEPHLYFHGEEQSYALRLFTHGWDMFHIPNLPVYHLYNEDPDNAYRRLHWGDEYEQQRQIKWTDRQAYAKQRLDDLVSGKLTGIYGLGNKRTVADYTDFCGIDYINKKLNDQAFKHKHTID